jgi:hypothetical protein
MDVMLVTAKPTQSVVYPGVFRYFFISHARYWPVVLALLVVPL